jgi:hypothetical protein
VVTRGGDAFTAGTSSQANTRLVVAVGESRRRALSVQLRAEALCSFFRSLWGDAVRSFEDCDDTFADLPVALNNLYQAKNSFTGDLFTFQFGGQFRQIAILLLQQCLQAFHALRLTYCV